MLKNSYNIITSFPKSGNTWMRYIIYELFFNDDNKENNNSLNIKKYIPDLHTLKITDNKIHLNNELKNKIIFLKTHFSFNQMKHFPINKVLIITRNPLDVFVSLYNYYELEKYKNQKNYSLDDLVDFFSKYHTLPFFKEWNFPSLSEHLESWINSNTNYCLLKYSDLINDFDNQIVDLCNFLNLEIDNKKIQIIKQNTSFSNLKKIETSEKKNNLKGFFYENMKDKKTYFMKNGKNDNYLDILNDNQILKLKDSFKGQLKRLNE